MYLRSCSDSDQEVVKYPTRCKVARLKCWPPFLFASTVPFCCRHRFVRFSGCSSAVQDFAHPIDRVSRFQPLTSTYDYLFFYLIYILFKFFNGRDVSIEMKKDVLFWSRQLIFRLPCIFVFYFLTYSNYLLSIEIFSQLQLTRSRSSILIDRFARATNSISS
jgi:hypothetical protein